jgi:hypothetical protein
MKRKSGEALVGQVGLVGEVEGGRENSQLIHFRISRINLTSIYSLTMTILLSQIISTIIDYLLFIQFIPEKLSLDLEGFHLPEMEILE